MLLNIDTLYAIVCDDAERNGWTIFREAESRISRSRYIEAKKGKRRVCVRVSDHYRRKGNWRYQVMDFAQAKGLVASLWSTNEKE